MSYHFTCSLRAGSSRPFIGLPARPDSTLIRSPDSDGPLNSAATAGTLKSHNESASPRAETSHRPRPVPRLSISSEDGETVDVDDIGSIAVQSSRHDLHASLPSATAPQAHQTVEVAMEIAEEVSRVCDFCLPLTTDAPLASAGLKRSTAKQMVAWLDARFDYEASTIQLLDENVTAEVLAAEIIGECPSSLSFTSINGLILVLLLYSSVSDRMSLSRKATVTCNPTEHSRSRVLFRRIASSFPRVVSETSPEKGSID